MKGKIAVFIGQINQEYSREMTSAVAEAAQELSYRLDVFSEFGSYGQNYLHQEGERNIIRLPFLDDYDAVIVAPDTFGVPDMEKQLDLLLFAVARKPIISIRQEKECFYNVQIDNRAAMAKLTEHFVKDHGYKRICFMKGRADLKDARERLDGYMDVMNRYGLPVTEHMLFQGNYWRDRGSQAVEWFLSGPEKPEAIICANDFMAISVLMALKERNIRVPEDIALAGFDDIEEARYLEPAITSVRMPCAEMGRESIYLADKLLRGERSDQFVRLPAHLNLRKSCGCAIEEQGHWAENLYRDRTYLSTTIMQNGFLNAAYENCDTMRELFQVAYNYSNNFHYDKIYVCLCETIDENGERIINPQYYTDQMVLRCIMTTGVGMEIVEERFPRRELLPEKYRKDGDAFYFFPMHHKNRCLGYLALSADQIGGLKEFFNCWNTELCSCVDKVLLYEENKMLQEFRRLSTIDELTGLYNRRKMEQELSKKIGLMKAGVLDVCFISMDMDGLKYVNDTFGHLEGDAALKAFANVIREATGAGDVCCRVGGDEFTIMMYTGDTEQIEKVVKKIREGIDKFNQTSGAKFTLDGSVGYARFNKNEEINNCIRRADVNMYADKMTKKRGR